MAQLRKIISRLKAIRNVRTVVAAMGIVASSRFKKAHDLAVANRPYTRKLTELVEDIARRRENQGVEHPLLRAPREEEPTVLLVLSGYLDEGRRSAVKALGVKRTLEKPFDLDELLEMVDECAPPENGPAAVAQGA